MQTRGRARTEWRLSVYRTSLALCSEGGFTLARFVSIPEGRLSLAPGEPAAGAAIPIWLDPSLSLAMEDALGALATALQPGAAPPPPLAVDDPACLPALDLALLDGRLEPRRLGAWLAGRGLRLERALAEALAKGLALVGRTPNGEELSLLCLIAVQQALQKAAQQASPGPQSPVLAVAALLLERATAQAAEHPSVDRAALSGRPGLRPFLVQSHYAFQKSIDAVLSNQLNTYRTQLVAVQAARGLLRGENDLRLADDAIDRIAGAVLSVPAAVEQCWIEGAMELVREALAEPYLCVPLPGPLTALLSQALSEPNLLADLCSDHEQREKLLYALGRISPPGPFKPVLELLKQVGAARTRRKPGDPPGALPQGGTLGKLASDQARGAYLMAADSAVRKLLLPLEASLQASEGVVAEREWKRGRRYRFGAGSEPIANAQSDARQGQLYVDLSPVAAAALRLKEHAAAFLRDALFQPVLEAAARLRDDAGSDDEALAVTAVSGEALSFRGEVLPLLELARAIAHTLEAVRAELEAPAAEALSGPELESLRERERELERLAEVRHGLQAQLEGRMQEHERDGLESRLREALAEEGEARAALQARRAELLGEGPEAGLFLGYGAPLAVETVGQEKLGSWPLGLSGSRSEAARGSLRPAPVRELRAQWSAQAGRPLAFTVSVGAEASVRLPATAAAKVSAELARRDSGAALRALSSVFRDLQAEAARSGTLSLLEAAPALYNEGTALSSEALTALRAATAASLTFLDRTLSPEQLAPALTAELAFPPGEPLVLSIGVDRETRQPVWCFRHAGAAPLAGPGTSTEVWELCDPRGLFVQLLARHHLPAWIAS